MNALSYEERQKIAGAKWRADNRDYVKRKNAEFYAANREEQKARVAAWRAANPEKAKAATLAWREKNQERVREMKQSWRARNPDKIKAHKKSAKARENPDLNKARQKRYQSKNAQKINAKSRAWYAANKEKARKTREAYRLAHMGLYVAIVRKRHAAKLRAIPKWADEAMIRQIYDACRAITMMTGIVHHVDHIVPLQSKLVCGLHCEANLQILEGTENRKKWNRHWPDMPE